MKSCYKSQQSNNNEANKGIFLVKPYLLSVFDACYSPVLLISNDNVTTALDYDKNTFPTGTFKVNTLVKFNCPGDNATTFNSTCKEGAFELPPNVSCGKVGQTKPGEF